MIRKAVATPITTITSNAGRCTKATGTTKTTILTMIMATIKPEAIEIRNRRRLISRCRECEASLNQWIARMPNKMAEAHLKLPLAGRVHR